MQPPHDKRFTLLHAILIQITWKLNQFSPGYYPRLVAVARSLGDKGLLKTLQPFLEKHLSMFESADELLTISEAYVELDIGQRALFNAVLHKLSDFRWDQEPPERIARFVRAFGASKFKPRSALEGKESETLCEDCVVLRTVTRFSYAALKLQCLL